jgi:adenosylcobinamide-phosphate synthase
MSFFAVLFALLLEQVKPLPRGNVVHDALTGWMQWTARNFDAGRESHALVGRSSLGSRQFHLGVFFASIR